jgi:hypothetical protein
MRSRVRLEAKVRCGCISVVKGNVMKIYLAWGICILATWGCTGSNESTSDFDSVAVVGAAIGVADQDKNEFRERKTKAKPLQRRKDDCNDDPRVELGLVSENVCVGADLFFREPFGGNGRACGTCHAAQFNFTIGPAFIASLESDDPLFIAENDSALAELEKPALMRDFGLILENVDGAEDPTDKFVMRSVPHCFSLAKSIVPAPIVMNDLAADGTTQPPNQRVGWSGDGAPGLGGLKEFQVGAIFQHYTKSLNRVEGVDFSTASNEQLSRIEDFLLSVGRTADITLSSISLSDSGAEAGRVTFMGSRCNGCHSNAGANTGANVNRNFNTGIETARIGDLDSLGIPSDGGFGGGAPGDPFNFDADGDSINDAFGNGGFNTPSLIEAVDTAPFFHTNAFETIEEAIAFYTTTAFTDSPSGSPAIPFNATDIANVGKFLRVLNAAFNCQIAIYRLQSGIEVIDEYSNRFRGMQFGLIDTARAEVRDALTALSAVGINAAARSALETAEEELDEAMSASAPNMRKASAEAALAAVELANDSLGDGIEFSLGQGTLMF